MPPSWDRLIAQRRRNKESEKKENVGESQAQEIFFFLAEYSDKDVEKKPSKHDGREKEEKESISSNNNQKKKNTEKRNKWEKKKEYYI